MCKQLHYVFVHAYESVLKTMGCDVKEETMKFVV